MGVIVVEKHLFYIEAQAQEVVPKRPNVHGTVQRPHIQVHLRMRFERLPWEGEFARSIGYMEDEQLNLPPGRVGSNIGAMRRFLLGQGYEHPKLLVADVSDPGDLLSKEQMARRLFAEYCKRRRPGWAKTHPVHMPVTVFRDAWLPYDPTQPGKRAPSRDAWLRQAHQLLGDRNFGTELYQGTDKRRKVYDTNRVIPIGVAYRIQYYTKNYPKQIVWVPKIQARVTRYLASQLGSKAQEWYVLGKFDVPVSPRQIRGRDPKEIRAYFAALAGHGEVEKKSVLRRLFLVKAKNHQQAQRAAEDTFRRMMNQPAQRRQTMEKLNAWERSGRRVVTRQRWVQHTRHLQEESSGKDSQRMVY